MPDYKIDFEYLERRFDMRKLDPNDEAAVELVKKAEAIYERIVGRKTRLLDDHPILLTREVVYLPNIWVGCAGYLVDLKNETVHFINGGEGTERGIWAYFKGFRALCDPEEKECNHRITFRTVHAHPKVQKLLGSILAAMGSDVRSGSLENLPVIAEVRWYPTYTYELKMLDDHGLAEFDVECIEREPSA